MEKDGTHVKIKVRSIAWGKFCLFPLLQFFYIFWNLEREGIVVCIM